jgi:hypothetical protein
LHVGECGQRSVAAEGGLGVAVDVWPGELAGLAETSSRAAACLRLGLGAGRGVLEFSSIVTLCEDRDSSGFKGVGGEAEAHVGAGQVTGWICALVPLG